MSELQVKHPDFANRLNEVMKLRGIEITELSEKTDIKYEMVRRYTHGYAKPREGSLRKIADALNVSLVYLDYGKGDIDKPSLESLKDKMKAIESNNTPSKDGLFGGEVDLRKPVPTDILPVISWVAAGSFSDVEAVTLDDLIEGSPEIPRYPDMSPSAFGLIVKGRSMAPTFMPGDVIHVEPKITPWDLKDGDMVVVQCDDGNAATFKQLIIGETPDDMYLKPLNPEWHEQKIIPLGECHLVGKVKYCTKRF